KVEGVLAAFADADELQEARLIGIALLAEPVHFGPETIHRGAAGLVAVVRQIAVDVIHLGAPAPRLDRAAAGHPDRRMRILHRPRPDVHIPLLIEAAVESERVFLGP